MAQGQVHGGPGPGAAVPESWQWMYDTARRTVAALGGSPRIEVRCPGSDSEPALLPAIPAIRAFRAEVYYAGGRRPSFRAPDGRFTDPDDADLRAHHVTCRDGDVLVGCIRAVPAELLSASPVEAHLGPGRAAALISELGTDRTGLLEAARLAVTAARRLQGIAAALMMVTLALARQMGRPVVWGTAGEGEGQDRFCARFGFRVLPGSSAYVPRYRDSVCVVVHDLRTAPPRVAEAIAMVQRAISGAGTGQGGPG